MTGRGDAESGGTTRGTHADDATGGANQFRASAGLALTWGGSQVIALLAVGSSRRDAVAWPPALILGAVAATAAGWVLLGGGRMGPSALRATLGATRRLWWGLVAGSVGALATVPLLTSALGTSSLAAVAPPAQVVLVASVIGATRTRTAPVPQARPWVVSSAGLAAFVAVSLTTSALALDDLYPLSRYPMYSAPRVGQHEVEQVTFSGVTSDGGEVDLGRPASRQVLLRLADDGDLDQLGELAIQVARERFDRVIVAREKVAITRHPEPVALEELERQVVVEVEIPRAGDP
jgi:hypothetical protein